MDGILSVYSGRNRQTRWVVAIQRLTKNAKLARLFPAGHKPASMVIGVSALAYPGLVVEINVRAVTGNKKPPARGVLAAGGL
ncbi:MAG: hypothetical protein OXF94_10455 [Gammaproteobacteria bacterium]|nr:hypothetical protein [Gammaproteobacteria bacterium]